MRIPKLFFRHKNNDATNTENNRNSAQIFDDLQDIQRSFFDLLKSSPLINRIAILSREKFKIDLSGSDEPIVIKQTKDFFESVISFWVNNHLELQRSLQAIPGRYIHIDQGQLLKAFRKYGLFFDGLLVSDQILLTAFDSISNQLTKTISISGPLWMSLISAANYLANEDLFFPNSGKPQAFLVPAMSRLDSHLEEHWQNGSQSICIEFFSELFDRQFNSFKDCAEHTFRTEPSEGELKPDLLNRILQYRGASNLPDYAVLFREAMRKEQGLELPEGHPPMFMVFIDVAARISEFERFSSDAYRWAQTNSVPYPNDLELYKWWAAKSSKIGAEMLGLPFDDDSLFVFAAESEALGFLKDVPIDKVLKAASNTSAQRLRQDLRLSDNMLRTMKRGAQGMDFELVGNGIIDAINRFDTENYTEIAKANRDLTFNVTGVTFSLGLLFLSQFFPPLSIISLLGGGSVIGTIKAAHKRKQILEDIRERPISALCEWNKIQH